MKAILVLEDGTSFEGVSFGAEGEVSGEVIFNTQVFGYQEVITDPSYRNKLVAFGYPHIGNVGINAKSFESEIGQAAALIVKEYSKVYSNWQATGPLDDFMKKHKILGIEGIDTRSLTIHIREHGEMRGVVSTKTFEKEGLIEKAKAFHTHNISNDIQARKSKKADKAKTVIINLGVNNSTLAKYPDAIILEHNAKAEEILALNPEQVVLSSGPGDPRSFSGLVLETAKLIGNVKILGIQNGACVLGLALGCNVYKMKVGHHGLNLPVVDPRSGKGEISGQNHGFGIDKLSEKVKVMHVNLNDKTVEKFESKDGSCVGMLYFPIDERSKLDPGYKYI